MGLDNYGDLKPDVQPEVALKKMQLIAEYAARKQKVPALTETGLENVCAPTWYTQRLLPLLHVQPGPAYCLVWSSSAETYWTPHRGHPGAPDFRAFKRHAMLIFGDRLPDLYKLDPRYKVPK